MARKTAPDWTPEEDEWMREFYPCLPNAELVVLKAEDGWPRDEWLRGFAPGHSEGEIIAEHERVFGFPLTVGQVANRKHTLGVKSGTHGGRFAKGHEPFNKGKRWDEVGISEEARERIRATQFRKGQLPHNTRPLLDTRVTRDGFTEIHVGLGRRERANDQWIPLSHFVWMQANGRDWPDGYKAAFADHDRTNLDPDNIVPVPKELWAMVNDGRPSSIPYHDRESLEAAILSAKISHKRYDLLRQRRAIEGHPWARDARKGAAP